MGFLSESKRLLFCGDLFASFPGFSHLPPAIFNFDAGLVGLSIARVLSLDLAGVIPNHGDGADPSTHLGRLRRLAG